jgi:hypothetical protein
VRIDTYYKHISCQKFQLEFFSSLCHENLALWKQLLVISGEERDIIRYREEGWWNGSSGRVLASQA